MGKRKPIDNTAARLGLTMRAARQTCHMSHDEVATLLRITPNELLEYELGITKIPSDVLEHTFVLGYKLMRIRTLEKRYYRMRNVFRKLKQAANAAS